QVPAADGGIGEHGDAIGLHLQDAAGDEDELLFRAVWQLDAHRTGLDARDQRRVLRIDAELARFARQCDELRFAVEDRLLGAHHVDMYCIHFKVLAFSKASSMPPTM